MLIITYRKVFFAITAAVVALSLLSVFFFGLHLGIDFTGGTLAEVRYDGERPSADDLASSLREADFPEFSIRSAGESGFIIRTEDLTNEERAALPEIVSESGALPASITRLTEVGPTIGRELRTKAFVALAIVLLAIMLFVAFAFRKVSEPVSSWIYGVIALVALLHDVIVPVGFYALLGHFFSASVDTLFVTAILTILGFSVHDTIVVFDRVRENLRRNRETHLREDFALTAGKSLNQTFVRSVNTSITVILSLLALFFFGPESTQNFALTLLIGIIAGTFSSIFLATPLLVSVEAWKRGK